MLKDNIREARKASKLTQKEVANIIGVSESAYCGYETGKRQPDAIKLGAIARALNVSGNYLLDLPEKNKTPPEISPEALMVAKAYDKADEKSKRIVVDVLMEYIKAPNKIAAS